MSIFDSISKSKLGYKGLSPESMAIVPDTLHFSSSVFGTPGFNTYTKAWLRKLRPTKLAGPFTPTKYLDNPPH